MGVWLVRGKFGPFVSDFIAFDILMAQAPSDPDSCLRFFSAEGSNVPPGLEGILLPWSRIIGSHPPDGRLSVREDGDSSDVVSSSGCHLQSPSEGGAFSIEGLLVPSHVGLVASPGQTLFSRLLRSQLHRSPGVSRP